MQRVWGPIAAAWLVFKGVGLLQCSYIFGLVLFGIGYSFGLVTIVELAWVTDGSNEAMFVFGMLIIAGGMLWLISQQRKGEIERKLREELRRDLLKGGPDPEGPVTEKRFAEIAQKMHDTVDERSQTFRRIETAMTGLTAESSRGFSGVGTKLDALIEAVHAQTHTIDKLVAVEQDRLERERPKEEES